jgi:hypothetical protein
MPPPSISHRQKDPPESTFDQNDVFQGNLLSKNPKKIKKEFRRCGEFDLLS